MTTSRVLISGAGVAGPALALGLRRRGIDVTIVERAPSLRAGGYKVDVRGAGTEVLKRLGIYEACRALDCGMEQITYVNKVGKQIAALPASLLMGRKGDDIELMRGDIGHILYDATKNDVEYVFGDSITSLTDGPDGVDVAFERGAPRRFDYVVGADGLHSTTRRLAFGEVEPTHLGAYISIFEVPNHLKIDREEFMYSRPGRLAFAYAMGADQPAKVGLTFASPPLGHDRRDVTAQKALVKEAFAGLGWETDKFLESIDKADDFYFDSLSQIELDAWSKGRVVLLGDAAHCPSPASGQGTSLALVGAYVLAETLGKPDGLEEYEQTMRPYVEKNMAFGRKMAKDMVPGGRLSIAFRNYGMRTLKFHPRKEQVIDKVLAPMHEAANAIAL
ncbi:2-polyprenyl-6-methoxyphenol hydroxylase-like FAD-dependent oxidoreductase [Actinoplanes tereljensis]|uniref:FAD-dependent oxidoreductase n=1 Tax=Paractinoplanes tereljensis TaxID=571912 RepID=A0A919TQL3_9ACTN|nr:FAD-dependent monooxygenase [Actinoplanes tereljensis]GIF17540.1 FAD-dependent oxidoreductase [Actinoplanes tereljensis]